MRDPVAALSWRLPDRPSIQGQAPKITGSTMNGARVLPLLDDVGDWDRVELESLEIDPVSVTRAATLEARLASPPSVLEWIEDETVIRSRMQAGLDLRELYQESLREKSRLARERREAERQRVARAAYLASLDDQVFELIAVRALDKAGVPLDQRDRLRRGVEG